MLFKFGVTRFLNVPVDPVLSIRLCGSLRELGNWDPLLSVPLALACSTRDHPQSIQSTYWTAQVELYLDSLQQFEYKFVTVTDGQAEWEGCGEKDNRTWMSDEEGITDQGVVLPVLGWKPQAGGMSEFAQTTTFYWHICSTNALHYDYIAHGIYLGSCPRNAAHMKQLQQQGVTAVVNLQMSHDIVQNCSAFCPISTRGEDLVDIISKLCNEQFGMVYVWLPAEDMSTAGRIRVLPHAVYILQGLLECGHVVYVHCNAGVGRSTAVVAAYLYFVKRLDLTQAHHLLCSKRPVIFFDYHAMHTAKDDYVRKFAVKLS